jgi:hypothetical protein
VGYARYISLGGFLLPWQGDENQDADAEVIAIEDDMGQVGKGDHTGPPHTNGPM